jgi:P-type E1-E2 ATPase
VKAVEAKIEGMSSVHVMMGGRYLGAVGLEDKLRRNAAEIVAQIRHLGVRKVCIFTGDRLAVAKRVGEAVGVDAIEAECLPEEKHAELQYLIKKGHRTLVVGDGINDGPILASADVGVAMGLSGSDIATNSAGVALMNDDLRRVPFLLELARKTPGHGGHMAIVVPAGAGLVLGAVPVCDCQQLQAGAIRRGIHRGRRGPPPFAGQPSCQAHARRDAQAHSLNPLLPRLP